MAGRLRRPSFEILESRQLLSVSLPTIANQTVSAGAPLNVALNASSTNTSDNITYTVSVSNSALAATVAPQSNPSIKMTVNDATDGVSGTMTFQLFQDLVPTAVDQFMSLVQQGFGSNTDFYRIYPGFMIQGGDQSSTAASWDDQISQSLPFTSAGILAMANGGPDTNSSQFFITVGAQRFLDFRYTDFGFLTTQSVNNQGTSFLDAIQQIGLHTGTNSVDPVPTSPDNTVAITGITSYTDTQNGVLRLSARWGPPARIP